LYLNPGNKNSWIKIKLVGTTTNKSAIGSKVRIKYLTRDGSQHNFYKTVGSGSSFGANELQISAGLNDATEVLSIEVRWANGNTEYINYGSVPIKKLIVITEGISSPEVKTVIPQLLIESEHHH
ncbi:ASPIC/UnbV domain-containing protein, partial [Saprospiraceae bacterium]|nr:ASPIC/UnbV domain-containing protein [Saprospiraceae bacterium]